MANPEQIYSKRRERFKKLTEKQARFANKISNFRLLTALAGLALTVYFYRYNKLVGAGIFAIGFAVFINLVLLHNRILARKKLTFTLELINQDSLKRLSGEWVNFSDTGEEYRDLTHPFSGDLDLFGKGSLFQLLNSTQTYLGREKLRQALMDPDKNIGTIALRQEALVEIGSHTTWRQRLTAEGMKISGQRPDPSPLFQWARDKNGFYRKPWVKYLAIIIPVCTCLLFLAHYFLFQLPLWVPILALIGQFILLTIFGKGRAKAFQMVCNYESSLRIYLNLLRLIEDKSFNSPLLQDLQATLRNKRQDKAYLQVEKLSKIVSSLSNRNNAMFLIVNILTLWDYQCMISLEKWKEESGRLLSNWLHAIGEVEALVSLAALKYDNPDWAFPEVVGHPPLFSAKCMGHPLLSKARVNNDLRIDRSSGILLITGSNMSGKSTLLRTVGINLVLAYAGAPVCAQRLRCSLMSLYSCMRISDNLEQSISSFYAELLRIKLIVEAAKTEQQVFFLLDEIFKGTNSQDRHTGAKLLIKQLDKRGALGLVSTHDLELGELEQESKGKIRNYHFREYYKEDKICFDYKLRQGISTTRNAMYLIKLAGIETVQENL